jgi:hypothetical protein
MAPWGVWLLLWLALATPAVVCGNRSSSKDWTLLVYMDAENDLDCNAMRDLRDMQMGFVNHHAAKMNVIVKLDRPEQDDPYYCGDHSLGSASLGAGKAVELSMGEHVEVLMVRTFFLIAPRRSPGACAVSKAGVLARWRRRRPG